jgi:rhamnosyltransferase
MVSLYLLDGRCRNLNGFLFKKSKSVFPDQSKISAVITTYRPDDEFPVRVERIRHQVGCVVIVDDGASSDNVMRLKRWFSNTPKVLLHHNETNIGIAASLNKGIAIAKFEGCSWALTLDDDTLIAPDMVQTVVDYWKQISLQRRKPIALMGMLYRDVHTGEISDRRTSINGLEYADKREIMTSGSLLSLDAYEIIGFFRNDFFIDFVDYDYCSRARSMGFRVIKIFKVGMEHSVGNLRLHNFAGVVVETYNHSPARLYYYFRNSLVFMREVFRSDPLFVLALLVGNLRTVVLIAFLESDKRTKIRYVLRGVLDGWRNRLGRTIAPS